MIHELDLKTAKARCIDLPGTGNYGSATSWTLQLSKNERTLWAVSPGYGRAVAIDVVSRKVSTAFRVSLPGWFLGTGTASALSPDGTRIALADNKTVAVLDLGTHQLVQRNQGKAIALGYAPDGRLWTLS
jgi:DNA-binding beta-propeller fold protein YncE